MKYEVMLSAAGGQTVRRTTLWISWKALVNKVITRDYQRMPRRVNPPPRRAYLEHACMARAMERL